MFFKIAFKNRMLPRLVVRFLPVKLYISNVNGVKLTNERRTVRCSFEKNYPTTLHLVYIFAVDVSFHASSQQVLATPLISSVAPLTSFWSYSIWCAQRTWLYRTDRCTEDVDDTRRVVRIPEFCLTTFCVLQPTIYYSFRLILINVTIGLLLYVVLVKPHVHPDRLDYNSTKML